ncbi:hypothetical protein [Streptomyces albidoflavus]|uniref:hypothetical protein n=1 Tax=Streptomyces albidoflavus TaxID=1886 RepID=UPI00056BE65F|nr:hypothetical protein [Streptomyces albidoflavus]
MALSTTQQERMRRAFMARLSDEDVCAPLWEFFPAYRPYILSERRRRNLLNNDPEPIGDHEYT